MFYAVFYKRPGSFLWKKLKNAKADYCLENQKGEAMPMRVIVLADETRIEIPMTWAIRFSRERFLSIRNKMEKEAGQKIK